MRINPTPFVIGLALIALGFLLGWPGWFKVVAGVFAVLVILAAILTAPRS